MHIDCATYQWQTAMQLLNLKGSFFRVSESFELSCRNIITLNCLGRCVRQHLTSHILGLQLTKCSYVGTVDGVPTAPTHLLSTRSSAKQDGNL